MKKRSEKYLAVLLSLALMMPLLMGATLAGAKTASGCTHEHDAACGYVKAAPCDHVHDAGCGYDEQAGTPCAHNCVDGSCGYTKGVTCGHVCDESCNGLAPGSSGDPVTPAKTLRESTVKTISAFEPLDTAVTSQSMPLGTALGDLKLPDKLKATVDGSEVDVPVKAWQAKKGAPAYDKDAAGDYVLVPAFNEGYTVVEGVKLPEITVTVEAATPTPEPGSTEGSPTPEPTSASPPVNAIAIAIAALDPLDDGILWQGFDFGEIASQDEINLPDTLIGTDADGDPVTISGVTWKSAPAFDPAVSAWYYFTPKLPAGYAMAANAAAPKISVFIRPEGGVSIKPLALSDYNATDVAAFNAILQQYQSVLDPNNTYYNNPDSWYYEAGRAWTVYWSNDLTNKRITSVYLSDSDLMGTLDVSGLTALEELYCDDNELTGLVIDSAAAATLKILNCSYNKLSTLDVSRLAVLESLYCDYNNLTALDAGGLASLTYLSCTYNNIGTLTLTGCSSLESLSCYNNNLSALDVSGFTNLTNLYCGDNALTTLDASGCTALGELDCYGNQLGSLDVSGCTSLFRLICYDNTLTTLDVSTCMALEVLACCNNQLATLDVSNCTDLKMLDCFTNQLTNLDLASLSSLWYLDCYNNKLTSLTLTGCTSLQELYCNYNSLTSLDVSGCNALERLSCHYNYMDEESDVTGNTAAIANYAFFAQKVSSITGVPATATAGTPLTLTGTVNPNDSNVTYQDITWAVKSAGATGATISGGNQLNTTVPGTVTVTATVANGLGSGNRAQPYTQDFDITVNVAPTYTCEIVETSQQYASLGDALLAVQNNQTIKLLSDIDYDQLITIDGITLTLKLDGNTLDVDVDAATADGALLVTNGGKLLLEGGGELNVAGSQYGVRADANSVAYVTSASSTNATPYSGYAAYANGGIIYVSGNTTSTYIGAYAYSGGSIYINGDSSSHSGVQAIGTGSYVSVAGAVTATDGNAVSAGSGGKAIAGYAISTAQSGSAVNAATGGEVEITNNVTSDSLIGVKADGTGTVVSVRGNVSGGSNGVVVLNGAEVTVYGDAVSTAISAPQEYRFYVGAYVESGGSLTVHGDAKGPDAGAYVTLGGTLTVGGDAIATSTLDDYYGWGAYVMNGGSLIVEGDAKGHNRGAFARLSYNSANANNDIHVKGNAIATGTGGIGAHAATNEGTSTGSSSTVLVEGNASGVNRGVSSVGENSLVTIRGNVSSANTATSGIRANFGGEVIVDGIITPANTAYYIMVGDEYKTITQTFSPTTKSGYFTYTDGTSTVWVKASINVTYTAAQVGGSSDTADSTGILITFSEDVTGLTANDITITGATRGTLTDNGDVDAKTWLIGISNITVANGGNATIEIADFGSFVVDTTGPQNVVVYKNTPAPTDASVSPTTATFDKNTTAVDYKDVTVTLSPGSHTLSAIKYGSSTLQEGTDYTVSNNSYTIKKEYLATLPTGAQIITFDMSGGANPMLTVTIKDTSQTEYPVIEQPGTWAGVGSAIWKIDGPLNKYIRLWLGGNVVNPNNIEVTEGSTIITFKESYLKTLSNGTYNYTAEFTDGYANLALIVNVQGSTIVNVTGVTLDKSTAQMIVGNTVKLNAAVLPENATNKGVTWKSSNESVATVDNSGKVTAESAGMATITVATNDGGYTAECKITVYEPSDWVSVTGITLNKSSATLKPGGILQLTATVSPANATDKGVTWASGDTSVATVDENGKVTAKKVGTATLTVTTDDGGYTDTCKVTVTQTGLPQTGDDGNMWLWIITGLLSILGGLCMLVWRKWRQLKTL